MAVTIPIPALSDALFGNRKNNTRLQGLQIFTDNSISLGPGNTSNGIISVGVVPQNIQFVQRSRISEQMIKDGRAFFFWRKDRNSNHLDLMEVSIGGITRSLAKESTRLSGVQGIKQVLGNEIQDLKSTFTPAQPASADNDVTPKQREWLRFWALTREPYVMEDRINEHYIRLQTPALPIPVTFIGHFTQPIQWGEVAENPFLVTWQLSLIVHRTTPTLETIFKQAGSLNVT